MTGLVPSEVGTAMSNAEMQTGSWGVPQVARSLVRSSHATNVLGADRPATAAAALRKGAAAAISEGLLDLREVLAVDAEANILIPGLGGVGDAVVVVGAFVAR